MQLKNKVLSSSPNLIKDQSSPFSYESVKTFCLFLSLISKQRFLFFFSPKTMLPASLPVQFSTKFSVPFPVSQSSSNPPQLPVQFQNKAPNAELYNKFPCLPPSPSLFLNVPPNLALSPVSEKVSGSVASWSPEQTFQPCSHPSSILCTPILNQCSRLSFQL